MATIAELRDTIIAGIKLQVPGMKSYEPYRGNFDAGKKSFRSPALYVAFKGDKPSKDELTGQAFYITKWAAYIYVKEKGNKDLELFESVQRAVFGTNWLMEGVNHSENILGSVLSVNSVGAVLMAVTWDHPMALGVNVWSEKGVEIDNVRYSFTPKVGTPHEPDYKPLIEGI